MVIKIEKIINKETEYPFIPSLMFIAFNSNKNESIVKKIDKLSNPENTYKFKSEDKLSLEINLYLLQKLKLILKI